MDEVLLSILTNLTIPGKTWHIAITLKIAIVHLHDTTTHDLAAPRFWKQLPVLFFRYDAFYSPVSAILELRNYVLNTLLRRWVGSPYTAALCTSEHVQFIKASVDKGTTREYQLKKEPGKV